MWPVLFFLRLDAGYAGHRHQTKRDVDMVCVASTVETSKVQICY